jgi:hypothetical protein
MPVPVLAGDRGVTLGAVCSSRPCWYVPASLFFFINYLNFYILGDIEISDDNAAPVFVFCLKLIVRNTVFLGHNCLVLIFFWYIVLGIVLSLR